MTDTSTLDERVAKANNALYPDTSGLIDVILINDLDARIKHYEAGLNRLWEECDKNGNVGVRNYVLDLLGDIDG